MLDAYLQHELWKWSLLMHFLTDPLLWLGFVLLAAFGLYHVRFRVETYDERTRRINDKLDRDIDALVAKYPHLKDQFGWRGDDGRWHLRRLTDEDILKVQNELVNALRVEPQDDEGRPHGS